MALGHNLPNLQNQNICPPCFYELDDEPELQFSSLVSIDGNNSLRHWAASAHNNSARIDTCTIESDCWLSAEEVNRFANEVKQKTGSEKQTVSLLLCCGCKANR
jgi:Kyakuja-Dileera-Zisupton transposase